VSPMFTSFNAADLCLIDANEFWFRLYLWIKWHPQLVPGVMWFHAVRYIDDWHFVRELTNACKSFR
jgi:hypothetical protein